MRSAAIVVAMLFVTVPVFGDQSKPNAEHNMRFGALRAAKPKDGFDNIFVVQSDLKTAIAQADAITKPSVVCGMLVIPADPKIDPKMAITPKKDANVEHTIRAIQPPVCNGQ